MSQSLHTLGPSLSFLRVTCITPSSPHQEMSDVNCGLKVFVAHHFSTHGGLYAFADNFVGYVREDPKIVCPKLWNGGGQESEVRYIEVVHFF